VRLRATVPSEGAEPESAAIARIDAFRHVREVAQAIRSLPRREREVLALIADRDLSYEETASALGVPIGTVRSRLARARSRLRSTNFGLDQTGNREEKNMSKRALDITALLS